MEHEKILKMKEKIQALIALGDSEKKLGNEGAAALIAEKVQELMNKYHLEQSDFQAAHPEIVYEPLIGFSIIKNPFIRVNARTEVRKEWAEYLADVIANNYYCRATINTRTGELKFYGVDFDRDIAIMMFEKLSEMAFEACNNEMEKAKSFVGKKGFDIATKKIVEYPKTWMGDERFINSFIKGFGERLAENRSDNKNIGRINDLINTSMVYVENVILFDPIVDSEVVEIGKRYGKYTAKQKASKVQKSANIQLSKKIKRVEDDRVGEVILIIDDSGSMSWNNKIQQAREGVADFAKDAISKKFAVGLIKFGTNSTLLIESKLELNGEFNAAISNLNGQSGGTYLLSALSLAASKMKSYYKHKKVLLIATDGAVADYNQSLNFANMLKASGIEIMTIGTYDADEEFLRKLSSGNKTLQVSDSEIRNALKGMAGYLNA